MCAQNEKRGGIIYQDMLASTLGDVNVRRIYSERQTLNMQVMARLMVAQQIWDQ